MKSILVFSAHPDDVEFGMGGTIRKCRRDNIVVNIIISFFFTKDRQHEAYESLEKLGVDKDNVFFTKGKTHRDIISEYDDITHKISPTHIFTHFYGDSHQEHKIVYDCALTSLRKFPRITCLLWENNQPGSPTHDKFLPIVYVPLDITDIESKIEALSCHKSQMEKYNTSLLFKFLKDKASVHGYSSGSMFAEVFFPIKMIMEL